MTAIKTLFLCVIPFEKVDINFKNPLFGQGLLDLALPFLNKDPQESLYKTELAACTLYSKNFTSEYLTDLTVRRQKKKNGLRWNYIYYNFFSRSL